MIPPLLRTHLHLYAVPRRRTNERNLGTFKKAVLFRKSESTGEDSIFSFVSRKIKTNILCSITFLRKSRRLWDNVEKYGAAAGPQMTSQYGAYELHSSTHMHTPMRPGTSTHAHPDKYVILIAFLRQKWFANAPQCYVTRILLCLFFISFLFHFFVSM